MTVMRLGLVHSPAGEEICLVRNISASGVCARLYKPKNPGEALQIELKSGQMIGGTIAWARGLDVGISFHHPIDVEDVLLSRWVSEPGKRARVPRLDVVCPGILRVNGRSLSAKVQNISPAGARVELQTDIQTSVPVVLMLPNLSPIAGAVRWAKGTSAGLRFNERLPLELVTQWVDLQRRIKRHGASHLLVRTPSAQATVQLGSMASATDAQPRRRRG